ncbi:MAG: hypothetical protein QGG48_08485, partial [Desulfatiglandales bacterium]|nr:hypothetical protein [Desulfatiglandales bacterium]
MKKSLYIFLIFLFSSLSIHPLQASPPPDKEAYQERIKNLESLLKSMNDIAEKIVASQEILLSPRGLGREQGLKSRINGLSLKLKGLEESFNQLSTEVDSRFFEAEEEKKTLDWNIEFTELFGPVIKELKKMTSRPREIEKLRSRME